MYQASQINDDLSPIGNYRIMQHKLFLSLRLFTLATTVVRRLDRLHDVYILRIHFRTVLLSVILTFDKQQSIVV